MFTVQSIPLSEKEEAATMFAVLFASAANGCTEDEKKFAVQHANDQRLMYHWPIATF